jgi:hypothetical protein
MLLSRHQNAGQNWDVKIANRSFENVSQFRYLGGRRKLRNEELRDLYSSLSIIRMIKSKKMRWAGM